MKSRIWLLIPPRCLSLDRLCTPRDSPIMWLKHSALGHLYALPLLGRVLQRTAVSVARRMTSFSRRECADRCHCMLMTSPQHWLVRLYWNVHSAPSCRRRVALRLHRSCLYQPAVTLSHHHLRLSDYGCNFSIFFP